MAIFEYRFVQAAPLADDPEYPCTETHGLTTGVWNNQSNPSFSWPSFGSSGYYVNFDSNPAGTNSNPVHPDASYTTSISTSGTYYLRIASVDLGVWYTCFTDYYETTIPDVNSVSVSESNGVITDTWQKTINTPSFSFTLPDDSPSGLKGYYLYWGTAASGTSASFITGTTTYNPGTISTTGSYYLRIQLEDNAGNQSAWRTIFIYKYDVTPPVPSVIETGGASNGIWQNSIIAPSFDIDVVDPESGFASFNLYWQGSPYSGNPITSSSFTYTPDLGLTPSDHVELQYDLSVVTIDQLGNASEMQTIFTFRIDTLDPDAVTSVTETNGLLSDDWGNITYPSFTWDSPSGATNYNVYWGSDGINTPTTPTHPGITPPFSAAATPGVDNYLWVQSEDDAGNTSAWSVVLFTYWYDNTPPSPVTSVTDEEITSGVCSTKKEATFTWDLSTTIGAPIKGYYYYWKDSPNPLTTIPYNHSDGPPLELSLPKGDKYYLRMAAYDEAGNVSAWNTNFILCNGDAVRLITAAVGESINLGVLDPSVHVSIDFPVDAYQIFVDPNWIGLNFWARLWYPTVNGHREPSAGELTDGKVTPYNHQSFNLATDLASDTSTLYSLTLSHTITMTYSDESILALKESTLKIYRWDGENWNDLGNQTLDMDNNTVTGSTNNVGEFILMADPLDVIEQLTITTDPVSFSEFTLSGHSQTILGVTNPWIILDANSEDLGWYITISGTDFIDPQSHNISIQNLSIQIPQSNISTLIGNQSITSSILDPISVNKLGISILNSPEGKSVGKYQITPIFKLNIPAETYAGVYSAQVVITLIVPPIP